ncbi:hypothetical protein [uncultured Polaribacter sp.]|uniref:hypothetical protein n=1 Tax=uncultured Polaribacter sp. TaxID=174711 RepID=UPI0030D72F1E|tara:strand:+ start:6437 stop:7309 length:873 start_codon:yes stop_codon:yes gene_type:complete
MKTSISSERIFKSSIVFLSITAFILLALVFTSCSDSDSSDAMNADETALVEQIESAAKIVVNETSLPAAAKTVFNSDLADSYVAKVQLAVGLGYKVAIVTDDDSKEEATSDVYFSLNGKQLADSNEKRTKRRSKCFEFVYPIDFIMPDNSSITLTTEDDWSLIKAWYELNPDETIRPELVFPVDVTLEDGTVQTLLDSTELATVKDSCRKGKDKRKCFKLVYPFSYTMPDATIIDVTERADLKLVREWCKANPDATEKGTLNFPVSVEYKDGTTATFNDQAEYDAAKDAC